MYLKLSAAAEDRVSVSVKAVDDSFTHPWRFMFRGTAKAHDLMEKACQFAESWLQQYTGGGSRDGGGVLVGRAQHLRSDEMVGVRKTTRDDPKLRVSR